MFHFDETFSIFRDQRRIKMVKISSCFSFWLANFKKLKTLIIRVTFTKLEKLQILGDFYEIFSIFRVKCLVNMESISSFVLLSLGRCAILTHERSKNSAKNKDFVAFWENFQHVSSEDGKNFLFSIAWVSCMRCCDNE